MKRMDRSRYQARARIIKALAHPTRLMMADKLAEGPQCVRVLTKMAGDDISTVSKHLAVMKNAGLVEAEKDGARVFYHLKVPCILGFLSCAEETLKQTVSDQNKLL
jgi:ArsR family transcriptional regulator